MIAIAVRPIATPTRARRMSALPMMRIASGALTSMTQMPAISMNSPSPAASIRYSGQWLLSAVRAWPISASRSEFGIEGHATIDEQRDPVDVIAVVRSEPHRGARNVLGLADALVGHEPHQRLVRFRSGPCVRVDRRACRARREAVDADAARRQLLRDRLHQHHHAALRGGVIDVPGPRDHLVHRAHTDDL